MYKINDSALNLMNNHMQLIFFPDFYSWDCARCNSLQNQDSTLKQFGRKGFNQR